MRRKILFFIYFIFTTCCFSQNQFEKIELEHSNAMIIGNDINTTITITIVPLKNRKHKMKIIAVSKNKYFVGKISEKEYRNIENAILKIDPKVLYTTNKYNDTISTKCLDGFSTSITTFKNGKKATYFIDCLSKMDKYEKSRKDFWYVSKLIFSAGRRTLKELEN